MKGYKAFNKNLQCRGFQYEIGQTYELNEEPVLCEKGFHFCKTIKDCYNYYPMSDDTRICEIEALGVIVSDFYALKYCTNKIRIVKEITCKQEKHANYGIDNTGYLNIGNNNSGNANTGNDNSGDRNTGHRNSGNGNTGHRNSGRKNTGNYNSGGKNTGHYNYGGYNTGDSNIGSFNIGDRNIGDYNTGHWNYGYRNTGNFNEGDYNTGDWNFGNYNTGCFNTEDAPIMFFNKPVNIPRRWWDTSEAKRILSTMPQEKTLDWVDEGHMTDEEKEADPLYKKRGGYLKLIQNNKTPQDWWDNLSEEAQNIIKEIPNFDADIFKECTGIQV